MKRMFLVLTVAFLFATVAFSNPLITFNTLSPQKVSTGGGQIAYHGGTNPLIGTNIQIANITAGSNTAACIGCLLNFTTGNLTSIVTTGSNRTWNFGPGAQQLGMFTVTGTVPLAGITSSTTLLSGYFNAPTLSLTGVIGTTPRYRFFSGSLFDMKNPLLVDYLLGAGFSSTYGSYFTGSYQQDFVDNQTLPRQIPILSDTLLAGSITNDQVVPEPGSVILISTVGAALGFGIYRRRKAMQA